MGSSRGHEAFFMWTLLTFNIYFLHQSERIPCTCYFNELHYKNVELVKGFISEVSVVSLVGMLCQVMYFLPHLWLFKVLWTLNLKNWFLEKCPCCLGGVLQWKKEHSVAMNSVLSTKYCALFSVHESGSEEVSGSSVFLLKSGFWSLLHLGSIRPEVRSEHWARVEMRRLQHLSDGWCSRVCRFGSMVAFLAFLSGLWGGLWGCLALILTLISMLGARPKHLPCPAPLAAYQFSGEELNSDGMWVGQKGREETTLALRRPLLPPCGNPIYCKMSPGGPVRGWGLGILYQGCSEHILFFKRTMFVNFMYTGKLLKMYLIL